MDTGIDTHIGKYWTGNIVYLSTRPFPAFCVLAEKNETLLLETEVGGSTSQKMKYVLATISK